ncbi:MAG: DUF4397 domain-containing protein [Clostridia bacterium]|nr:DUF4397 domain-containing protein [Clostridia bacterium]
MFDDQNPMHRNAPRNRDESYIRIFHASPNAPAVDVYANGMPLARNLRYRDFTLYQTVQPGTYRVEVYPAGRRDMPVLATMLTVPPRSIFTIAAIGMLPNISLLPIAEPKIAVPPGKFLLRFSHLSPTAPSVDLTLANGTVLFSNVRYTETTSYIPIPASTYHFQLRLAGTNQVVLEVPNIALAANRLYTIYAIGLPGGQPPLQVVIPLDGSSYITP